MSAHKNTTSELTRRLLVKRGVNPDQILSMKDLCLPLGPQGMAGMIEAIRLIEEAKKAQWPVMIVGDYDVDGACATVILRKGLSSLFPLRSMVPNRLTEGYGLSEALVDRIDDSVKLVITVDNGISAHAGIAKLKKRGVKVIVTDHHLPGDTLPEADVIIDPSRSECPFPFKSTCGAGVAWYLLWGIHHALGEQWVSKENVLKETLDLVALATVADLVPLESNNRILVAQGLKRIRAGKVNAGLSALMALSGVSEKNITEQDFGFRLGPRINAAGRLADIQTGIRLLLSQDPDVIQTHAKMLDEINSERKKIQATMDSEAQDIVQKCFSDVKEMDSVLCVSSDDWHSGVVGIVASKLKERYQRPAFVFTTGDDPEWLHGSGRSMPNWHLRDALALVEARHAGLIQKYGGHAMAAGLTISKNKLDDFKKAINQVAQEQVHGVFDIDEQNDGPLRPEEITLDSAKAIEQAGPWGQAFPSPVFSNTFIVEESKTMRGGHWKIKVKPLDFEKDGVDGSARFWHVVHFLNGKEKSNDPLVEDGQPPREGTRIQVRYQLQVNRWNGSEYLQLQADQIDVLEPFERKDVFDKKAKTTQTGKLKPCLLQGSLTLFS